MMVDAEDAANLVKNKFCEINAKSNIELTGDGRRLIEKGSHTKADEEIKNHRK